MTGITRGKAAQKTLIVKMKSDDTWALLGPSGAPQIHFWTGGRSEEVRMNTARRQNLLT